MKTYVSSLRDARFILWEQIEAHKQGAGSADQQAVWNSLLDITSTFAEGTLSASYRESDENECHLDDSGRVRTPSAYGPLLEQFRGFFRKVAAAGESGEIHTPPPPILYLILEMLMGANPSFMTYVGFIKHAGGLLRKYGPAEVRDRFAPMLTAYQATAALCATEQEAGSDLGLIKTRADRQDDGSYLLTGRKWLISAGMHELTPNILYFVLARTPTSAPGVLGLSCFVVPRYRLDEAGRPADDNGVRCEQVVRKMGLKGCANTLLSFGEAAPCKAYLLGTREGAGLSQMLDMMMPARLSTGIFALGLAGSACNRATAYAAERLQGRRFDLALNGRVDARPIGQHPDVQRMLLDMAAVTSGSRSLIAFAGLCEQLSTDASLTDEQRKQHRGAFELLTPLVKAYISDSAWTVATQAIQVHGGVGYLRDSCVEQNARDIKVLSIWEGANHLQSQFLVRDALGLGMRPWRWEFLKSQIVQAVAAFHPDVAGEARPLFAALEQVDAVLTQFAALARKRRIGDLPAFSTEFQECLAETVVAWLLLWGASVASGALDAGAADRAFYQQKVRIARFFVRRRLPCSIAKLAMLAQETDNPEWGDPEPVAAPGPARAVEPTALPVA